MGEARWLNGWSWRIANDWVCKVDNESNNAEMKAMMTSKRVVEFISRAEKTTTCLRV